MQKKTKVTPKDNGLKRKDSILLSVVTPNYNDADSIAALVESVLSSDIRGVEQIVVDDGSTDNSRQVLRKLEKKWGSRLTVIYCKKNAGACIARNLGAQYAKGKYLSFLPADAKLYPGMARLWIETLEANPDYDFFYGGYRFIDENGTPVNDYMGDQFDPYFLETANYIDGSFPLKRTLFDKMGGWDPKVKSLQDWDFWLNAVKRHGAKGLYQPDLFFETTLPHSGGLSYDSHSNWLERTNFIKAKYGIADREICVTGQGARFHAKNVAKMLNADYKDMPSFKEHKYKMIYVVGFFGNVAQAFFGTDAMRVVHWIGSDLIPLLNEPDKNKRDYIVNWIKNNVDVNLTEFEHTQKELESIGIKSRICPLPPRKMFAPMPLPKKFTIAVYDPYQNKAHYYPDLVKEIASEMKDVEWKFFGDSTLMGRKGNIEHLGTVDDIEALIKDTSALLRISKHDGLPLSVIEWASAGRNIITNVPTIVGSIQVTPDKKSLVAGIKKAMKAKQNFQGSKYYIDLANQDRYVNFIQGLLKYDPKKYWEDRAECWDKIEGQGIDAKEEYIITKEIEDLSRRIVTNRRPEILDIGCGNGKWFPTLSAVGDYSGVDISSKLIKIAKTRYPEGNFKEMDIREIDKLGKKYDIIFSYTSLLHITPSELESTIAKLRGIGKWLVMIEPTKEVDYRSAQNRQMHPEVIKTQQEGKILCGIKSSFVHNYGNELDIDKIVNLEPRTLMICKL